MGYLPYVAQTSGRTFRVRVDLEAASVFCEDSASLMTFDRGAAGSGEEGDHTFFCSLAECVEVVSVVIDEFFGVLRRSTG